MRNQNNRNVAISQDLLEAINSFPITREVTHCGSIFQVSPFDIQVVCPICQMTIKVRAFSALAEIEDVFDAVFEWMMKPNALSIVKERQEAIMRDREDA